MVSMVPPRVELNDPNVVMPLNTWMVELGIIGVRLAAFAVRKLQATWVPHVVSVEVWLAIGPAEILLAKLPWQLPVVPVLAPAT